MTPESTMHSSTPCAWAAGSARSGCPARDARVGVVYGRAVGSSADATAAKARRRKRERIIAKEINKFDDETWGGKDTDIYATCQWMRRQLSWCGAKAGGAKAGARR